MRTIFNHLDTYGVGEGSSSAIYLFIRQMCYSSMFRYNKSGEFNVPYGGISYNKNNFDRFIKYFKSTELDRKSTRLNSSHVAISYAVFCLKKKKAKKTQHAKLKNEKKATTTKQE